jgi:hypothetical protein
MNDDAKAMALFRRRKRISITVSMIWVVIGFFRAPFFVAHWPSVTGLSFWFYIIGILPVCGLLIWAGRCTVCGGGIKLDGRTCKKCGRVFK